MKKGKSKQAKDHFHSPTTTLFFSHFNLRNIPETDSCKICLTTH